MNQEQLQFIKKYERMIGSCLKARRTELLEQSIYEQGDNRDKTIELVKEYDYWLRLLPATDESGQFKGI